MRKEVPLILDKKNDKMFLIDQYRFSDPAFKITVTATAGQIFTIPLKVGYSYNFTANWGDGTADSTITAYNDADISHTYTNAGNYQISMVGLIQYFGFIGVGSRLMLKSIDAWGNIGIIACDRAFDGCSNLTTLPLGKLTWIPTNTGSSGGYYRLFTSCTKLASIPVDFFDLAVNVQSFVNTFWECFLIPSIPNNLLYNCAGAIYYSGTFRSCRFLVLPTSIFNLANLSITTTFANFMDVDATSRSPTGTIQDIWNYTTATSTDAFDQCTAITNYASIPGAWT